jgi:hypothetical protein
MFGCGISRSSLVRREVRRVVADFVLALLLFWGVAFTVSSSDMRAHAVPLSALRHSVEHGYDPAAQPRMRAAFTPNAAPSRDRGADLAFLSLAFAALLAGNLAFWRHLRRVYASPRRNVWRRG